VGCGRVLLARGSLDEAASTLAEGVALGRQWANWESIFPGMICLARIRAARGETSAASALTAEVAQLGKRLRVPDAALDMITLYGALFDAGGNRPHESALTHVKALIEAERDQPLLREEELILGARLLLSGEEWTRALDLLAAIEVGTRAGGRIAPLIEVALLRARGLLGAGKGDEAKAAVAEASGLAAPSGFLFPFLEAGSAIVPLIERLEGNTPFHKRILGLFGGSEGKASPAGLSERELDVLGLLAGGLSNQQIAERLYVSANTVKSHLKSIFAKLDVESRTQAVARARELGIAP